MAIVAAAASIVGAFWGKVPDTEAAEKASAMQKLMEAIANFGDVLIKISGTFHLISRKLTPIHPIHGSKKIS